MAPPKKWEGVICSIEDCDEPVRTMGLCAPHYKADHFQKNKERYNDNNRKWLADHPEMPAIYAKTWRDLHPELFASRILDWQRANPEKVSENNRKRNSLRRGATSQSPYTRQELWDRDQGKCHWCGLLADFSFESRSNKAYFTVDHIIPLVRGGADDLNNVVVAHLSCNQSHNNKLVSELPVGWVDQRIEIMTPIVEQLRIRRITENVLV